MYYCVNEKGTVSDLWVFCRFHYLQYYNYTLWYYNCGFLFSFGCPSHPHDFQESEQSVLNIKVPLWVVYTNHYLQTKSIPYLPDYVLVCCAVCWMLLLRAIIAYSDTPFSQKHSWLLLLIGVWHAVACLSLLVPCVCINAFWNIHLKVLLSPSRVILITLCPVSPCRRWCNARYCFDTDVAVCPL